MFKGFKNIVAHLKANGRDKIHYLYKLDDHVVGIYMRGAYPDYEMVVFGDTYPIREKLAEHFTWNKELKAYVRAGAMCPADIGKLLKFKCKFLSVIDNGRDYMAICDAIGIDSKWIISDSAYEAEYRGRINKHERDILINCDFTDLMKKDIKPIWAKVKGWA